jgi:putative MFS transporter
MLPVSYALLTEMLPLRRRGMMLVLVGGLGAAGGFFAASGLAALFEPIFGWRALWLVGLPTGILVLLFALWMPESPAYLVHAGRLHEARREIARFGGVLASDQPGSLPDEAARPGREAHSGRGTPSLLVAVGIIWGLVNFGLLLWLPSTLASAGMAVGASSRLLAASSFVAFLTILPATLLYQQLGGSRALILSLCVTLLGLAGIAVAGPDLIALLLLLVGINTVIAMLLPYAAECASAATRGRAVGWVAAGSKGGGLLAQAVTLAGLAPAPRVAAIAILLPLAALVAVLVLRERRLPRWRAARRSA